MAISCEKKETDDFHQKVRVTNNADYPVYVTWTIFAKNGGIEHERPLYGNITEDKDAHRVSSGETNTTAIAERGANSIEGFMGVYNMKVFFIDPEIFDPLPFGSSVPDEAILSSRVYNLEDLRAISFHIDYPLD